MACLSQQFEANSISHEAKTPLLSAWRKSTEACYDSAWKQWVSWCLSKQINPVSAPLNAIIEYLTHLFHLGREYRTINLHRSAISKTHPPIDSVRVEEHPLVFQLLKGVFQCKPLLPRYTNSWKVSKGLDYLVSLGPNDQLSLKSLSLKLAILFMLTSAERSSEVQAHDLRFRKFLPEGVVFNLPDCYLWSSIPAKNQS